MNLDAIDNLQTSLETFKLTIEMLRRTCRLEKLAKKLGYSTFVPYPEDLFDAITDNNDTDNECFKFLQGGDLK